MVFVFTLCVVVCFQLFAFGVCGGLVLVYCYYLVWCASGWRGCLRGTCDLICLLWFWMDLVLGVCLWWSDGGVFGFVVAGVVRWFLGCLIVLYL